MYTLLYLDCSEGFVHVNCPELLSIEREATKFKELHISIIKSSVAIRSHSGLFDERKVDLALIWFREYSRMHNFLSYSKSRLSRI